MGGKEFPFYNIGTFGRAILDGERHLEYLAREEQYRRERQDRMDEIYRSWPDEDLDIRHRR